MKLFEMDHRYPMLFFLLNMYVCTLGRELQSHGSYAPLKRALHRQKRPNYSEHDRDHHSESSIQEMNSACSPAHSSPLINTIIKSSASIDNGAKYINARNGTSRSECFNLCCQDPNCDTSIYEDKGTRRCYLFDCHGQCQFKEHSYYVVWDVEHRNRASSPPKEEEELAHLHGGGGDNSGTSHHHDDNDDDSNHRSSSDSSTSDDNSDSNEGGSSSRSRQDNDGDGSDNDRGSNRMGPPAHAHTSKPGYVAPHTAGLAGYCESDVSCEDPNAGCFSQACHCKKGFYNKNDLCRKMCSQTEFECLALGTSGRGPECVPKSQICDSYMQCADGSDEFNCRSQVSRLDSGSRSSNLPQQASSAWMTGQGAPVRGNTNYDNGNYNAMDRGSGRQIPVEMQPALQKTQHSQNKLPTLNLNVNDKSSATPEKQGYSNYDNSQSSSKTQQQQQRYNNNNGNTAVDPAYPSVRPMNPMASQPVKPSRKDRNQLPAKSINENDNQRMQASFHNTNSNPANPQPTNIIDNAAVDNLPNTNQNNDLSGASSHSSSFTSNHPDQDTKSYSNSPPIVQSALSPPRQPDPNHILGLNNAKEPLSHHNDPSTSNKAYSQKRPPLLNRGRILNPVETQYNSQSSHSQFKDNPNTASHTSDTSRLSQGRDGVKIPSSGSHQQRVPGSSENPLPSLPKSSSPVPHASDSKGVENKNQHDLVQVHSSNAKQSSPHAKQEVEPNNYGSSLLSSSSSSSSSSSRQQPRGQSWLDGNPYLAYGSGGGGNQRQRQQMQPSRNNQYYDPTQYYPQYNTDALDSLPPSLLGDTRSQDDFSSQFGGPYADRQKPLNRMPYPLAGGGGGSGNPGYVGYQDPPYNSQYNPSSRYNYGGEFGGSPSNYQDTDFYSSLRNPNKEYQSPGLYEDEQSSHQLPSSGMTKNKGTYIPGTKLSTHEGSLSDIHKTKSTTSSDTKEEDTKVSHTLIPKMDDPTPITNEDSAISESVKNKTKQNSEAGPVSISKTNLTHPSTKKPHSSHNSDNSKVFVTQEKVIIASSSSEAEGPIIALSLGLAFTLILIALLGCRLRNMKHRLRKGRPLSSNEADYLINGMYL